MCRPRGLQTCDQITNGTGATGGHFAAPASETRSPMVQTAGRIAPRRGRAAASARTLGSLRRPPHTARRGMPGGDLLELPAALKTPHRRNASGQAILSLRRLTPHARRPLSPRGRTCMSCHISRALARGGSLCIEHSMRHTRCQTRIQPVMSSRFRNSRAALTATSLERA